MSNADDLTADMAADPPRGVFTEHGAGRVSGAMWEDWSLREIEDEAYTWRNLHPDADLEDER
ncbi:hypothetical protein [Dietzia aurantiaca]|uniref:Uncharacterized protein n=1 Tax=Dietzia aurantiaca TaxID=983873 RepID=A0ABV9PSJ2_9ACTN